MDSHSNQHVMLGIGNWENQTLVEEDISEYEGSIFDVIPSSLPDVSYCNTSLASPSSDREEKSNYPDSNIEETEDYCHRNANETCTAGKKSTSSCSKMFNTRSCIPNNAGEVESKTNKGETPESTMPINEKPDKVAVNCDMPGQSWLNSAIKTLHTNSMRKHPKCVTCAKTCTCKADIDANENVYTCTECEKQFNDKTALRRHMNITCKKKAFTCVECGRKFARKSRLNKHMQVHAKVKKYTCTECGHQTHLKSNLNEHMYTHTRDRVFICSICNKQCTTAAGMRLHMNTHTKEHVYVCKVCNKQYTTSAGLRYHIKKMNHLQK